MKTEKNSQLKDSHKFFLCESLNEDFTAYEKPLPSFPVLQVQK